MQLSIVSHLPESDGRTLRPYHFDDIDNVGVFGDEPYGVNVQNSSSSPIQVIVTIDGRNVLTGRPAELDPRSNNFVVPGNSTLPLQAWPETTEYGARFVFTHASSAVASHTPGGLGALGYISAAVYEEGDPFPIYRDIAPLTFRGDYGNEATLGMHSKGVTRSAVGTGAGKIVSQPLGRTRGLRQPRLKEPLLRVRYMWWDDLVARLRELGVTPPTTHPTGFETPTRWLADLGSTPRPSMPSLQTIPVTASGEYPRFF